MLSRILYSSKRKKRDHETKNSNFFEFNRDVSFFEGKTEEKNNYLTIFSISLTSAKKKCMICSRNAMPNIKKKLDNTRMFDLCVVR